MKRLFVASATVAALYAAAGPACASTGTSSGNAQLRFTSAATQSLVIATQYSTSAVQGNALPTLLPSVAGVCTASGTETNFTLTFGALSERPGSATACLYKNAVAIGVSSNDASGFVVNEYLDAAPTAGVGICAFPNSGASFPMTPAVLPVAASSRSGNPAAGTFTGAALTSCAAGGSIVPAGAGGASSGGSTPGNPGAPGLEYYAPSTTQLGTMTLAAPTVSGGSIVNFYAGQDIQVNLAAGAASTLAAQTGVYMTIQLVPN